MLSPGLWRSHLVWGSCYRPDIHLVRLHGRQSPFSLSKAVFQLPLQVLSSVIAAWADIGDALATGDPAVLEGTSWGLATVTGVVSKLNVGYFWMLVNCLTSAAYVSSSCSSHLSIHRSEHAIYRTGIGNAQEDQGHGVLGLGFYVLQQPSIYPCSGPVFSDCGGLVTNELATQLVSGEEFEFLTSWYLAGSVMVLIAPLLTLAPKLLGLSCCSPSPFLAPPPLVFHTRPHGVLG